MRLGLAVRVPKANQACPEPFGFAQDKLRRRVEDIEAGGSMPGLPHQPVCAVLVGVIALAC